MSPITESARNWTITRNFLDSKMFKNESNKYLMNAEFILCHCFVLKFFWFSTPIQFLQNNLFYGMCSIHVQSNFLAGFFSPIFLFHRLVGSYPLLFLIALSLWSKLAEMVTIGIWSPTELSALRMVNEKYKNLLGLIIVFPQKKNKKILFDRYSNAKF